MAEKKGIETLEGLEAALKRDLDILDYPKKEWVQSRSSSSGQKVYDVLIIGGGQSGLSLAFGLMREKVSNLLIIDENPEGLEGPWKTFARMITLRTPKYLTGPDWNLPNLTFRAWYEAQWGEKAYEALHLIPKETWADYLIWYRKVLKIPVQNETRAGALEWLEKEQCFKVPVLIKNTSSATILARKVVLATGIDGSGRWDIPDMVKALPKKFYAHTREEIDFASLKGKRLGVLGAGASAFDNASRALEEGAKEVHLYFRRKKLVDVNPYRWAEFTGFLKHQSDMPDDLRWKFVLQILRMGQLPPHDTYMRATQFPEFNLHADSPWEYLEIQGDTIILKTKQGSYELDYLIIGTGFVTDLSLRPELENLHEHIALWKDRYTAPDAWANSDLERHPYLGKGFQFQEKHKGSAPYLESVFNYTFGDLPSHGFSGASITGLKYSLPKICGEITRQLYAENTEYYFQTLLDYTDKEF